MAGKVDLHFIRQLQSGRWVVVYPCANGEWFVLTNQKTRKLGKYFVGPFKSLEDSTNDPSVITYSDRRHATRAARNYTLQVRK